MWLFSHMHNKRIGHSDACEPWGYVAPVVAAVVTRAHVWGHFMFPVGSLCYGSILIIDKYARQEVH